jgi:exodeoxyribonuclease VII small subunit
VSGKSKRADKAEASGPSFEQALARLEEIAHQLEGGDLPLEEAIALAEEGIKLSQLCEQQLTAAEGKIQQLVERMGRVELAPLETEGAEEEEG